MIYEIKIWVSGEPVSKWVKTRQQDPVASTLTTCPSDCNYATILSAVDTARTGDTIQVEYGTYNEQINMNGKDLTLRVTAHKTGDTNGDGVIGLAEAIHAIQVVAGIRD